MNYINGTNNLLSILVNDIYYPIACLKSNGWAENVKTLGTTTRENLNGWRTSVMTDQNYSISFDGLLSSLGPAQNSYGYSYLVNLKRNRIQVFWKLDDGVTIEYGKGFITNINNNGSMNEYISFSGSIKGSEPPKDTPYDIFETKPNLFVVDSPYWVPTSMSVGYIPEYYLLYMAARPDAFVPFYFPDVTDFIVRVNTIPIPIISVGYNFSEQFLLELGQQIFNGDIVTVEYNVGTIELINTNGIPMLSLPETQVKNTMP